MLAQIEAVSFRVANRNNGTIVSSGETREYLVYVPPSYDRNKPTALVLSMHGAGGWPAMQRETSQWNRVADREGFPVERGWADAHPQIFELLYGEAEGDRHVQADA